MTGLLCDADVTKELQNTEKAFADDPLRSYFEDIAAVPAPTEDERINGFRLTSNAELRKAVEAHLILVVYLARRWAETHRDTLPLLV